MLVDKILTLKQNDINSDISRFENEIDLIVYKLYELTYDEVLIIDLETPISKSSYEEEII